MNTIIFFLPTEYRITLAIDRCSALTFRFLTASWWKIHSPVVELLSAIFSPFMSVYIYLEYHRTAVSKVSKVHPISVYQGNLIFFLARHVIKSLLHKEETSLNISGKEVDLARNLFHKQHIYHQKSINIPQSFCLGSCSTLYREGLINVNRNLHKAVYRKEDFNRWDRRRLFSIRLVFIRQFWDRVCKRDSCST